ncbi:MAG: cupredoxin domain-containing protein [Jatrophihabitantaceae bacterium]
MTPRSGTELLASRSLRVRVVSVAGAALLAGGLAACGSSGTTHTNTASVANTPSATSPSSSSSAPAVGGSSSGSSASTGAVTITIKNYSYTVPASVQPGAKITVHNEDGVSHTVTADSGAKFDVTVPGSGTAMLTAPSQPGSYKFHCNFHGNMHGTLVVK